MSSSDTFSVDTESQATTVCSHGAMRDCLDAVSGMRNVVTDTLPSLRFVRPPDTWTEDAGSPVVTNMGVETSRVQTSQLLSPRPNGPRDRFQVLQKWEGVVEDVRDDSFDAWLIDLHGSSPDEGVELPLAEVSEADRRLVVRGAVFFWTIGYLDDLHGQRYRSSAIRFRRLPARTESDRQHATQEASRLADAIGWK